MPPRRVGIFSPTIVRYVDEIVEGDEDAVLCPTVAPGRGARKWLDARAVASADLTGNYCSVTNPKSVALLYPHSLGIALGLAWQTLTPQP
ncbi:hypothetical protein ABIE00_002878 [Arthrobacter sp. OAP107]